MIAMISKLARFFSPDRPHRLAIVAIVKNEGPYLLEWIAFHRVVGVERFFIADNVSNDGTTELLVALEKAGLVDRFLFPTTPGKAPQLPAYRKLIRRYGKQADWLAVIDADEFLTPIGEARSVIDLLDSVEADPKTGAVCINWAMFGSSNAPMPANEPVTARFSMRAEEDDWHNKMYKTILRTKAYRTTGVNPHSFELKRKFHAVQTNGKKMHADEAYAGISDNVVWNRIRLNHYFVKSKAEFELIKRPRGRADVYETRREDDSFSSHDHNDIAEPMPEWLVTATLSEMKKIRDKLRDSDCSEEFVVMDTKIVERVEALKKQLARN